MKLQISMTIALAALSTALTPLPNFDFFELPSVGTEVQLLVQNVELVEEFETDADTVVRNLQTAYESIQDFTAGFTQESTNVALGETRTSTGSVYFLRPGRMLWDYETRRLILDGENIHTVDLENAQYFSAPMDSSELPTAMRFLIGEGDLTADFDITLMEESTDEEAVLDLVPKVPNADYSRLMFVVSRDTWNVAQTTIVDALGNTNTIRFDGLETNVGMQADAFAFVPTPDLVEMVLPN
ncbi:MAG: outer membrane lipoprotein carrier protein [Bradymonadia bacterium]|jgi:outer membrane lipoprotein carrier protein